MNGQRVDLDFTPGTLDLDSLRRSFFGRPRVRLDDRWRQQIERGRSAVESIVGRGESVYGINTGFGRLAQTRIAGERLAELQVNLVRSHSTGTGPPLEPAVVRLALLLKLNSLGRGHSGVTVAVVDALATMLEHDALPYIPSQGSVGASGDLAPLAHLALALTGEGQMLVDGRPANAKAILERHGIRPVELAAKEGLALLNGTQISTALALGAFFRAERNAAAALVAGALSVDAALASVEPFDARIHALRAHPGQIAAAAAYRRLLENSAINRSHAACERVQDPYCLRCQPQVMGACIDQLQAAAGTLMIEANAVSDNPLIFPDQVEALSGGNFHGEPVAFAADNMALAVAETGALSERRIAMLIDSSISTLPAFLVTDPGLHSGFMVAHVTAAALASENKSLAHPASVDSLPTSANQEDHVSMSTFAARRLANMNRNTATIVGIELLAAAQGIHLRRPLTSSAPLEEALSRVRAAVAPWGEDRFFAPDIETAARLVEDGVLSDLAPEAVCRLPPSAASSRSP